MVLTNTTNTSVEIYSYTHGEFTRRLSSSSTTPSATTLRNLGQGVLAKGTQALLTASTDAGYYNHFWKVNFQHTISGQVITSSFPNIFLVQAWKFPLAAVPLGEWRRWVRAALRNSISHPNADRHLRAPTPEPDNSSALKHTAKTEAPMPNTASLWTPSLVTHFSARWHRLLVTGPMNSTFLWHIFTLLSQEHLWSKLTVQEDQSSSVFYLRCRQATTWTRPRGTYIRWLLITEVN